MDTTTSVIATGFIVTVGRWADDKDIPFRMFIGFGFLAVFLAVMGSGNQKLSEAFASLVLVTACLYYGVPIGKKLGAL